MNGNKGSTSFRRTAIALAVGLCLSGAAYAQSADGNIVGRAHGGTTVTLSGPSGQSSQTQARPDGSFSFSRLPAGTYKVTADGVSRDVVVAAGVDSRVSLESAAAASEKITVTGSRIQRDTFNSTSPITVITREETMMSGFNSTTAALQSTGVTTGGGQINNAFGGFVTDGGPGANTISLRGLGATRTLVLLNGRRIAPAGTRGSVGSADLNVLPTAVVDRIEILKDGASSIYGSDAVAGVINVITKKNIKGVTLEAQYNVPEHGGGEETRASATFGYVADKGYFSGTLEIYDRKDLKWGDRDWMACQTDYRRTSVNGVTGAWGSGDFIDPRTGQPKCYGITGTGNDGVTVNTLGTATITGVGAPGSVGTAFNRWRPNSAISTGLPGYEGVGGGSNNLNVRDTLDPRIMNNSLVSPARLTTGFFQGGYDTNFLGHAEVYGEALFSRRESHQVSFRQLTLDYSRGNPLIPASLSGLANFQAAATAIAPGPVQLRAFIGAGNYKASQDIDYTKVLGGLKGDLPFRDWKYDAVVTYSSSDANYGFEVFLTDRVANSLDVVQNASGTFSCRNTAATGCVAAPALTPALLGGALPQAWMDYVYTNTVGKTKYKETTTTLNTSGTLFAMQHGDIRGALGFEYRRAEIDDTPSTDMQNGNLYNFTSAGVTRGKDSVWEVYGEAEVPVLKGIPGAEELTLNVSGRHTDYKSYGADQTYKIGILYTPVRAVTFRAAQGTSYRAPALFEQYVGGTTGFLAAAGDPCNNYAALDPASARARNCASENLPNGGSFLATSSIASVTIGGHDAGLAAETSKNKSFGIILQPELPTGMGDISFAVDYYDIKVDNGVSRIGTGNILALCYDQQNFGSPYCRLITRAPAGTNRALTVNNSYVNVSTNVVKGLEYTLRYVRNIGEGIFRGNMVITNYTNQSNRLFPTDPLATFNNTIGNPRLTGTFDATYTWKKWKARYGAEWVDSMQSYGFFGENPATSTYKMDTPSYTLHNLSMEYKADKWSVIVGARNILDKEPPPISQGFANRRGNAALYSGFDYVGRTWFVNGSYTF
jgi:outer membrane receptor protein involved in Fe transport